jgi:hypothetical protein
MPDRVYALVAQPADVEVAPGRWWSTWTYMGGGMGHGRGQGPGTLVRGPRKDTVIVDSMMGRVDVDFTADNPGRWLLHCHHAYHMEMGMIRLVEVQ